MLQLSRVGDPNLQVIQQTLLEVVRQSVPTPEMGVSETGHSSFPSIFYIIFFFPPVFVRQIWKEVSDDESPPPLKC